MNPFMIYELCRPDGPMNYFHAWTEEEVEVRNTRLSDCGYYWRPYTAEVDVDLSDI